MSAPDIRSSRAPVSSLDKVLWSALAIVVAALVIAAAGGAYGAKLDVVRWVADSAAMAGQRTFDHNLLIQMNQRLTDIWCASVPPDKREGCR